MDFIRQQELVNQTAISQSVVSIIGCGAIGSAVAITLAKMGVGSFVLYDNDRIDEVNLPNQMYRIGDLGKYKVEALAEIIREYSDGVKITAINNLYVDHGLEPIIIVATDSMFSRKRVWIQYLKQNQASVYIEARMGAEEGQVYTITSKFEDDIKFYQDRLYPDSEAKPVPCTAKAIIYNVFMIASLVCRAYKSAIQGEPFPREVVFGMAVLHKHSFMIWH